MSKGHKFSFKPSSSQDLRDIAAYNLHNDLLHNYCISAGKEKKVMNKRSVLVVSNKQVEGNALNEWTSIPHPFHVNIVDNDEAAIELLHQIHFDMVVVDGTDSNIDGRKLHAVLPILQEDLTVLKYEGETAKELEDNVEAIFNAKKYQRLQRMLMLEPAVQGSLSLPAFSLN